tara:strand:- start:698 stop:1738 length:1041 start_codon:yes stop_codon:yes gene_type:complete
VEIEQNVLIYKIFKKIKYKVNNMVGTNYYKETNAITEKLAKKIYTEIYSKNFYMIGIILSITEQVFNEYNIDENLHTSKIIEKINNYPISVKLLSNIVKDIYDEVVISEYSSVSICYTIKQIELYIRTIYHYGYKTIYYDEFKVIFRMFIDYAQRDVTKSSIMWYETHGSELNKYWGEYIICNEGSFKMIYKKNKLVGGEFIVNANNNIIEKEMYIYLTKNNIDYIKFIHKKNDTGVDILWHVTDILEYNGDIISDGLFYKYGGPMCRAILEEDDRVDDENIKIRKITKIMSRRSQFIKIIKDNFKKKTDTMYSIDSPWGEISIDIDVIKNNEATNIYQGELNIAQ